MEVADTTFGSVGPACRSHLDLACASALPVDTQQRNGPHLSACELPRYSAALLVGSAPRERRAAGPPRRRDLLIHDRRSHQSARCAAHLLYSSLVSAV